MRSPGRGAVGASAGVLALGSLVLAATLARPPGDGPSPASVPGRAAADTADPFPHGEHAGLFALCTGCHGGIGRGDSARFYPEPGSCANCHDGEQQDRVQWSGPAPRTGNLTFDHAHHAEELEREGEAAASCESCHAPSGEDRMAVTTRAVPDRCLSCHEHEADDHYADASCSTCHVPLAETGFGRGRIAGLPEPADHGREAFLAEVHGESAERPTATCRTCHARERCTSCHVEGQEREAVAAIPAAPADMDLPPMAARYPVPETHRSGDWLELHAARARPGQCSTCHTRQSCASCHRGAPSPEVARLPDRRRTTAPGVEIERRAPVSHRRRDFPTEHGDLAGADPTSCASCHSESTCADCHAGPAASLDGRRVEDGTPPRRALPAVAAPAGKSGAGYGPGPGGWIARGRTAGADTVDDDTTSVDTTFADTTAGEAAGARTGSGWPGPPIRSEAGGFHPENFMERHSAAAYGNRMECSSCHDTGAFCRECHARAGMGSAGRIESGFHDAQPIWLLRHGQAARQSLESCASCHRQRDCIQCHSTTGAFSVSPHGPDFDARRYADRNRQVCLACHLSDPLGGGPGQ